MSPDPSEAPRPPGVGETALAGASVLAPATFLILNGLFGLVLLGLISVPFVFNPEGFLDSLEDFVSRQPASPEKQQAEQNIAEARQALQNRRDEIVTQHALMLSVPAVLNLVAIIGGFAMQRRSSYALSMAAAVVSLIPLATGCCLTGIPFGIWAVAVLIRPEVKAAFLARRNAPPPDPDAQYMR